MEINQLILVWEKIIAKYSFIVKGTFLQIQVKVQLSSAMLQIERGNFKFGFYPNFEPTSSVS
ncbi:hypothetical protein [Pedobacter psychrodurus]|uniref:hypothetical protein n=1 Tax=Pedobacter psychrodurus TaxID=2530456 RepID=UPI00292F1492|nr:hypothetical protein [Pedobacter psychrodurus]